MGSTSARIAKSAGTVIIISTISKLLGLIRESVMAAYYGVNYQTDAYRVAFEIPSILTGVVFAAITITFIPVYSDFRNETEKQRQYFVNNLFNVVILITALIAVLGIIFAPMLVKIAAPGFSEETLELSVRLAALLFPSIVFLALAYLSNGFLQANRSFAIPASMGIPLNLIIIFTILFFSNFGIEALAIGSLIAMAGQFLIQAPFLIKAGFRFKPVIDFKEPGFRRVLALSIPVFISTAFSEASILVDKVLASGLDVGSISILDYAGKVNGIANGIFFTSVAVVFFPELSHTSDDPYKFGKTVTTGLKLVILISLPIMAGIWALKLPIIQLLFERGEFNSSDTYFTSIALGLYSIGIIGSGLTAILNRAFYSLKDTKTPMINGIIAICANIFLSLINVRIWGVFGLALSSALAALLSGLSLFFRIRKRAQVDCGETGRIFAKSAVSAAVMGLFIYLQNRIEIFRLNNESGFIGLFIGLAVSIGIGGLVYIGMLYILKTEELIYYVNLIKSKFAKR
jgi:putative peptidoglycan lipid II flippase